MRPLDFFPNMSKDSLMNENALLITRLDQKFSDYVDYQKETNGRIMEKQDYTNGRVNSLESEATQLKANNITKENLSKHLEANISVFFVKAILRSKLFWTFIAMGMIAQNLPSFGAFIIDLVEAT